MNYQLIYDKLIESRKNKLDSIDGEVHHIIPRWRWISTGKRGDLEGDPDTDDNLVKLTYREHLLAHRLLARLAEPKFLSSAYGAVMLMISTVEKKDRGNSRKYEAARRETISRLRRDDVTEDVILEMLVSNINELKLVDGSYLTVAEITRLCAEKIFLSTAVTRIKDISEFTHKLATRLNLDIRFDAHYRSLAQREHAKNIMTGKIWATIVETGEYVNIHKDDFDENHMILGRKHVKSTKGMIHVSKDGEQKAILPSKIDEFIAEGWKMGGLTKKSATKNYINVIIDGKRDFVPFDVAAEMWKQGRCTAPLNRIVGSRGAEVIVFSSILEMKLSGFSQKPKLERAKRVVIHKDSTQIMVPVDDIPSLTEQGWKIGRRGAKKRQALKRTDVQGVIQ